MTRVFGRRGGRTTTSSSPAFFAVAASSDACLQGLLGSCWREQHATALVVAAPALAHNPDTSYARFEVTRDALTTEFTYDLFTLLRIAPQLDANGDRQVTAAELTALAPEYLAYFRRQIRLEIDGQPADFGEAQPVAFPPDVGDAIPEQDYHAATSLVRFAFRRTLPKPPASSACSRSRWNPTWRGRMLGVAATL